MEIVDFLDISNFVTIYNVPYENLDLSIVGEVDVVLTSPPYFDLEIYSQDKNQCMIKHNNYEAWLNQWLQPLIKYCTIHLNPQILIYLSF